MSPQNNDKSNFPTVETLNDLISHLYKVFESDQVNVEYVIGLMEAYKSNTDEWQKFAKFDKQCYTRNLVDEGNGKFNLMLVCWQEGHKSPIHDHSDSHCFMKMLDGTVKEIRYDWPDDSAENKSLKEISNIDLQLNQVCYISDSLGLHSMEISDSVDTAVSLHLYSPPFSTCKVFDKHTGSKSPAYVTFWSKFGERTTGDNALPTGAPRN